MGAGDEVAAGEGDGGESAGAGTHAAVHATELGGADEEVEGEGGGMVGLVMEGEPVTGGHTVEPGRGARAASRQLWRLARQCQLLLLNNRDGRRFRGVPRVRIRRQ